MKLITPTDCNSISAEKAIISNGILVYKNLNFYGIVGTYVDGNKTYCIIRNLHGHNLGFEAKLINIEELINYFQDSVERFEFKQL